ncbi:hypothetical protein [Colwellia psychrerythraea]|uniref:Solute-binding protein family 3/N-terminal domain-containing protein n=1 Tax=Colwellia psychrerythraea TaxID=28229 RepID=A0A099L1Y6_COLPS|nr:hypothetical protein [Colwellia psychrerythraea]KGJ96460.1 hypothetical protein GAB14E_0407 [Colwellia psychrerythraea]
MTIYSYGFHRKSFSKTLFIVILFCITQYAYARKSSVLIYIRDDVYIDYQQFVVDRDVSSIDNFSGKNIRRDVVDMIIAQQALKLGGFKHRFSYAPGKVNFRNTQMLQNGQLLISFDSYWRQDALPLANKVYISDEVIRNGEYIAGIYTSPDNAKTLAIKTLSDLTELTSVSTPKWRTDWQTLQQLPLKTLTREDSWLSMVRMVNIQWIDFILMPFNSTPDQSFVMDKVHLIPVKNIGVVLKDSRHFVISKAHPMGEEAYIAINKGLKIMRQRGAIVKAYQQAGFFVDTTKVTIINHEL